MTLKVKMRGRAVELDQPLDWPDGTEVEIEIKRLDKLTHPQKTIGGWPEDPQRDETLERIQQERHTMLMQEPEHGVSS